MEQGPTKLSNEELAKRLQFLENLLARNCSDVSVGLVEFCDRIETGWEKYLQKFKEVTKNI